MTSPPSIIAYFPKHHLVLYCFWVLNVSIASFNPLACRNAMIHLIHGPRTAAPRLAIAWLAMALSGCDFTADSQPAALPTSAMGSGELTEPNSAVKPDSTIGDQPTVDLAALRPPVEAFCGNCHAPPRPESFARDNWFAEVERGFNFYFDSGRSDLQPPKMDEVVAYYRAQAPEQVQIPAETDVAETDAAEDSPVQFTRSTLAWPGDAEFPAVAHLRWWPAASDRPGTLLLCDMGSGQVASVKFSGRDLSAETLATLANPSHVERADLDGDGADEFLVADLGSFLPGDHARGSIIRLKPAADRWQAEPLLTGVGRVCDLQPADFDADGDLDLVAAEFGWLKTGRILWLEQMGNDDAGTLQFTPHELDPRHGAIHVPVADLNADGRPDFVALISQEHEVIEAFFNCGDGQFEHQTIHAALDPAAGSSGIQLIDLDGDADLDVLYTNGDLLDSFSLKPSHAIHWLENRGRYPFTPRRMSGMPGVLRAEAADLDGDGDQDIAAVAFVPPQALQYHGLKKFVSLLWLEQVAPGEFRRHVLKETTTGHVALACGDFDADGRTDLAVGGYQPSPAAPDAKTWLTIWWNAAR